MALLQTAGLLKLTEGKSLIHLSQADILENPKKFNFVEVDQQSLSKTLPDVDAGFLFIRLGAEIGLKPSDALLFEKDEDALPFINLVAAKPGFAETEKGKALEAAYHSDEVRNGSRDTSTAPCRRPGTATRQRTSRPGTSKSLHSATTHHNRGSTRPRLS